MNNPAKEEARKRIESLTETINHHNRLYYQEDEPEISDFDFDRLLEELVKLENAFPEFKKEDSPTQRIGGTITKTFETATHSVKMLSLGNTYSKEELIAFDERVAKGLGHRNYDYFCELKFDGVAISLVYEKGRLIRAVTRGDGYKGDVVTENVRTIRNIPLTIKDSNLPEYFEVRGEVFLPRREFDKINKERKERNEALLANPRNAASGTLKMQDSGVVAKRRLNCNFYQLIGDDLPINHHHEAVTMMEKWGLNISTAYKKVKDIHATLDYIEYWREKRHQLPVDTDGVVIKVNNYYHQEELGFTAKIPRWAIAFKYQAEKAKTKLQSITYQVGRTGAITPVANLSPVSLAGTTVKRASLHNANEIERLDLHEGDMVWVEKGGEIIPKITAVIKELRNGAEKPISFLKNCPECGTKLERNKGEAKHFCPNAESCPPQVLGRMEHFVSKRAMDIDSLGTERLRALIHQGYIRNPADIYDLPQFKDELMGLEISDEQYVKSSLGYLFVSLKKALYAITESITLKEIEQFLADHESMESIPKIQYFRDLIPKFNKRVEENTASVEKFLKELTFFEFDQIEDYVPVAVVIAVMGDLEKDDIENIKSASIHKSTVHDLITNGKLEFSDTLLGKIKKLKGNTFQEGVIFNMMEGIRNSISQPFPRVLFALGIRNIGENTAVLLAEHFKNMNALQTAADESLLEINGIGNTAVNSIKAYFSKKENLDTLNRLKNHGLNFELDKSDIQWISKKLEGKKILASGKLNHFNRDEIIEFIASHGGIYSKTVSKSLDFIIEGEEMGPSKKEKALKLGIQLISEEEFLQSFTNINNEKNR
ncbi:MAG: NAD-dependent DNA ligase LigA [Cyclobacteriaceae bacterium]